MVAERRLTPEHVQLMVHRLEAQERASTRMMDRIAAYSVFSFAVLGIYVGGLLAIPNGPSVVLVVGAFVMAALFVTTFFIFWWTHRPAKFWNIPNPNVIAAYPDVEGNAGPIEKAFTDNEKLVWRDQNRTRWMLRVVALQVAVFLGFSLTGLIAA
ncbi:MAG: hypothetical protein F4Y97_05540 [Dehalococcoidia bacterium]|nr:hypothetical protein [Dehalococcoidia bacterium]